MPFNEPFYQKSIVNGTREWNVDDPSVMHMPDFRVCEAELATSKAMWVDGDPGPRCNCVFELRQRLHKTGIPPLLDA
jgi:hypothetical protein